MPSSIALAAAIAVASTALGQVPALPSPRPLLDSLGQANDAAGTATAVFGDVALVGARGADAGASNAGKVCVFRRADGAWSASGALAEPVPSAGAQFGTAVALTAQFAFATAVASDGNGRLHVFPRSGTSFGTPLPLASPNRTAGDRFGDRIAADGAWLAVGAPARAGRGAVDLFRAEGSQWTFVSTLTPPTDDQGQLFGRGVSLRGTTLAIGMPGDSSLGPEAGAVDVFELSAGTWNRSATLRAPEGSAHDLFGASVAIDGSIAAIGAYRDDGGVADSGSAYVFRRIGGSWSFTQKLLPENALLDADFGYAVAISGNRLAIGAPAAVIGGSRRGTTYVLEDGASGFVPRLRVGAPASAAGAFAGTSVSLDGATLLSGAPLDTTVAQYAGACGAVDLAVDCDSNGQPDAVALALGAADLNGDGIPDTCQCPGDFTNDGITNGSDLGILLGFWGTNASTLPKVDIDRSGRVDGADLGLLLGNWGPCGG